MKSHHHIGVDSGTIWVGDPCYLIDRLTRESWVQWIADCDAVEPGWTAIHPIGDLQGVWVGGFGGDGTFPVTVERDTNGRVTRVTVEFAADDEGDEDEHWPGGYREGRDRDAPYHGFGSQRAFDAAYENEVYCVECDSHPCCCDRR